MTAAQKESIKLGRPMTAAEEESVKKAFSKFPFTTKFKKSLEFTTLLHFDELRLEHPEWELTKVLGTIVQNLPKETPPALLLEMTKLVVEEWEKQEAIETASTKEYIA